MGGEWQPVTITPNSLTATPTRMSILLRRVSVRAVSISARAIGYRLAYLRYYPRYAENGGALLTRIKSNVFQASVDSEHWTTVGAITENALPQWFTLDVDITESFRYFRIYCPENSYAVCAKWNFTPTRRTPHIWRKCKRRRSKKRRGVNKFILSSKAMLVSPREHTQKDFNDKALEYFSLTSESAGRKALIAAQEAFRNANEEKYTSESYLAAYAANEKTGALLSDTDASEQSLVAAAEELNSAVSALTVSIIKLDKADGTKYFGQGGTWGSTAECFDKQFDGDVSTYTDYAGTMDGIGGFDIGEGAASVPTGLRFYLRTGVGNRYKSTRFEASADNESWTTLYTVQWDATAGE